MKAWDSELSLTKSVSIYRDLALRHCTNGGQIGTEIAALLRADDFRAVCLYELDFDRDWEIQELIECRAALGFFQKLEDIEIGIDKRQAALDKYMWAEEQCRATNIFFRQAFSGQANFSLVPRFVSHLESARRKIRQVLGRCPSIDELKLGFGPGATTSVKRTDACPMNKMGSGIQCSYELASSLYLRPLLREVPHWTCGLGSEWGIDEDGWLYEKVSLDLHPGRLEFVPKNAKTYRPIQVEPNLNSFLQKGIGRWMDARLRLFGLDIHDQSRNARLARQGSLDGSLATLDLSSASDLIAYELVKFLLPTDWFSLLNAARTGSVELDGEAFSLQKFSSMGNGFTFPLETLLFWALSSVADKIGDPEKVGIYGDDIIIPTESVSDVIALLHQCGFSVNLEKSFWTGHFRESCGKDYYKGVNVRPYYAKHRVSPEKLFILHNHYQRNYDVDSATYVKNLIPRHLRIYGPDGYGDGHLVSHDYPRTFSRRIRRHGYGGFTFDTFQKKGRKFRSLYPGDYVSPLYSIYVNEDTPLNERTPTEFSEGQDFCVPIWDVPGSRGYERRCIYTLG